MFRQLLLISLIATVRLGLGQQFDDEEVDDDYRMSFDGEEMQGDTSQLVPQEGSGDRGPLLSGYEGNQKVFDPMNDDEDLELDDPIEASGEQQTQTIPLKPNNQDPLEPGETELDEINDSKNPEINAPTTKESPTDVGFEIEPYNPDENEQVFKSEIEPVDDTNDDDDDSPPSPDSEKNAEEDKKPKKASSGIGIPVPGWIDEFWGERWFVAALLGGAIVGFLIIVIVIIFICHAVRKKDEGSYVLDKGYKQGTEPRPNGNSEFYA